MPQPPVLEVDEFLSPIAPGAPVGEYLRWEDAYSDLEELRRADEDAAEDEVWQRERKTSDWGAIVKEGTRLLREQTKDLQIAAWVAEALAHQHGLVGIRDGLGLVAALQEAFWDEIHPEHGDLELREAVYEFLDLERVLPLQVKNEPLTHVAGSPELGYSFMKHEEARNAEIVSRKTRDEDERELHLAGKLRKEQFDDAFKATEREFYVDLLALIEECQAVLDRINAFVAERWPAKKAPPRLHNVLAALADVKKLAGQLLSKKPAPEAVPPPSEVEEAEDADDDQDAYEEPEDSSSDDAGYDEEPEPVREEEPARRKPARRRAAGEGPSSAEDAREQIAAAAHYLRQADASDPTPYLVLRALAMGGVFASADERDAAELPPPSSGVREKLVQYARADDEESWASCLEEAEQAMGRPEGRGWLDLHWYACRALAALGREAPARAGKAILKAALGAHPAWPGAELRDGTPAASSGARSWMQEEGLLDDPERDRADDARARLRDLSAAPAPSPASPADEGADGPSPPPDSPRDPWDEARALVQAGDLGEALAVMARAARQAGSGRERFIRALQQAELCMALDRNALAMPILEGLALRVDELHLDQWEDASLCARVFSNLYRCLRGRDDARAGQVYDRLCRLDIGLALQVEKG